MSYLVIFFYKRPEVDVCPGTNCADTSGCLVSGELAVLKGEVDVHLLEVPRERQLQADQRIDTP